MAIANKRLIFIFLVSVYIIYTGFVYTKGTETDFPITENAQKGRIVFQKNNCIACHQLYGLGGYMGPDLTNVISNKSEEYCKAIIVSGTNRMPKFDLVESEIAALIDYLSYVDASSEYPIKNFETTWYGTIQRK